MRTFTTRTASNHIHNAARGIMNMRSLCACLIAMTVPCVSSATFEQKVYPAWLCVESGSAATVLRYGTSFVFHTSATAKALLCPVVKDQAGEVDSWGLYADRNGATATWTAFLISADIAGTSGNVSNITIGAGAGVQSYTGPGVAGFSSSGQMLVSVPQQPANARLVGYKVNEVVNSSF